MKSISIILMLALGVLSSDISSISGRWVRKDYYDELLRTKSPNVAYKFCRPISELCIHSETKTVDVIWNYHEGSLGHFAGNQIILNDEPYQYSISQGILEIVDSNNNKYQFIRIPSQLSRGQYPSNLINSMLLNGEYCIAARNICATFENDSIRGWNQFDRYFIQMDFMGPGDDHDQIILYKGKELTEFYWKRTESAFSIYRMDSKNFEMGNELYRLVQQ